MDNSEEDIIQSMREMYPEALGFMDEKVGDVLAPQNQILHTTSTGVMSLDLILGGLPAGIVEIYGPESTGKTTLLAQIMKTAQRNGMPVALAVSETLDEPYFRKMGVDTGQVAVFADPESYVDDMLDFLVSHPAALLAIDSITGIRPEDDSPGKWNDLMYWLFNEFHQTMQPRSCIVVTSQVRTRRSIHPGKTFGSGTDTASRRFTDMFATRLELSRTNVSETEYTMVVNVLANVLGPPSRYVELPVEKGRGINEGLDLIRVARTMEVVERRGPMYYFGQHTMGVGEKGAASYVESSPEVWLELASEIYKAAY